ncbi:MAG TPA: serine hydrolase [Vicinamibacterales bacterium]|nr:serine hydrolase [Vicinamibacterales bacterium]
MPIVVALRIACGVVIMALALSPLPAGGQAPRAPVPAGPSPAAGGLAAAATALPQLRSLLVSHHGELIAEYYARGVRPTGLANIKSASKSLISSLVGVAIDRGLIAGVRQPIATWFPELLQDRDRRKASITIEDLLTMRAGLESTSGRSYGRWVQSPNWVRFALSRPMVAAPGEAMQYSTGSSHLLSAILTKATRRSTWQFAQDTLARPLGFSLAPWPTDGQGIYFGGNEMLLTPRQMITIGELYLHRGSHGGRQVVPAAWVETSCVPRTASVFDADRRYGYGWWIQEVEGRRACFAWGYGGQYIFVFRELDLVVVATSATAVSEERRDHRRRLFDLIGAHVLGPLR